MKRFLALMLAVFAAISLFTLASCSEGGSDAKGVKVINVALTDEEYAFGVDKTQPELLESANAFIKKIMEDGTF